MPAITWLSLPWKTPITSPIVIQLSKYPILGAIKIALNRIAIGTPNEAAVPINPSEKASKAPSITVPPPILVAK
jgi:hypothetical protein